MSSEDFIIKVEQEGENIGVSLNGDTKQLMIALGCTVETMVKSAGMPPALIKGIVEAALFRNKPTEGSEEK